jgi:hypothetical protein
MVFSALRVTLLLQPARGAGRGSSGQPFVKTQSTEFVPQVELVLRRETCADRRRAQIRHPPWIDDCTGE